jgi:hypothetical protein
MESAQESWVWTSSGRRGFVAPAEEARPVDDANELVARLSTAAGIIMEDSSPIAISRLPDESGEIDERLNGLEQATRDANALIQAAQVVARRDIR